MTVERYEEIKRKYERARDRAAKAEGAKEQLLKSLKDEWGLTSIEEIENKMDELERQKIKADKEIVELGKELEAVTDWEAVK